MALLRSVHRTTAPIYGEAVEWREVTHSAAAVARRLGLEAPAGYHSKGTRAPGGRMYTPSQPARGGLRRVMAVASALDWAAHNGAPWDAARLDAVIQSASCGNAARAAYWWRIVEQQRTTWNHARRVFGREAGLVSGRKRGHHARHRERAARRRRMHGHTPLEIAGEFDVTERTVYRWLRGMLFQAEKTERHDRERRARAKSRAARGDLRHERTKEPYVPPSSNHEQDVPSTAIAAAHTVEAWDRAWETLLTGLPPPDTDLGAFIRRTAGRLMRLGFRASEAARIIGLDPESGPLT